MKQKLIKISQKTLFIYKSAKLAKGLFLGETTDPTTATTTSLTTTTGFFK